MVPDERPDLTRTPSFGRCFASLFVGLSPFVILMAVSALFGADTVTLNGGNVYGLTAVAVSILLGVIPAAILAGLQKLGYLILDFVQGIRATR